MELKQTADGFTLLVHGKPALSHSPDAPMLYVGRGKADVDMYRGNFKIEDYVTERAPLSLASMVRTPDGWALDFGPVKASLRIEGELCTLDLTCDDPSLDRFWLRVAAEKDEKCYGCGEQMSYFNLRGHHFPLWSSEPGVGRDKSTYVTWRSDVENRAGGDYYNTNYPQPTFVSTNRYYLHVDSTAYADFDFRNEAFHELQIWEVPRQIRIEAAGTYEELLEKLTAYFGRQPELPDWVYNGVMLGVQGGQRSFDLLDKVLAHDVPVSALWCQDWAGKRVTSFGKRLQWDWKFQPGMYPDLPAKIEALHKRGIRFMNYSNPYLVKDGALFQEGAEKGYFAKHGDGSIYLVDFGEFECGAVDLTNPEAFQWYKKNVLQKHTLDIGVDGWMADFGEYQPVDDLVLYNGEDPMLAHNEWPVLWAKCCYEAVRDAGKLGEAVYFMRAGGAGSQKYCTLLWAGDQSVDFSRHDGLVTTVCAALSAGMMGCGLSHSDSGGNTSLFDNCRTKELFLRWSEAAAFTPVMRTHEGNRPDTNFQFYDDEDAMAQFSRLVRVYKALSPYTKTLVAENAKLGHPCQRPIFFHYEDDGRAYDIQDEYLYGRDMLVAPVWHEGAESRSVYLPDDRWVHLWTGKPYGGGEHEVPAPMGQPPVFWRADSPDEALFRSIQRDFGT